MKKNDDDIRNKKGREMNALDNVYKSGFKEDPVNEFLDEERIQIPFLCLRQILI